MYLSRTVDLGVNGWRRLGGQGSGMRAPSDGPGSMNAPPRGAHAATSAVLPSGSRWPEEMQWPEAVLGLEAGDEDTCRRGSAIGLLNGVRRALASGTRYASVAGLLKGEIRARPGDADCGTAVSACW